MMLLDKRIANLRENIVRFEHLRSIIIREAKDAEGVDELLRAQWGKDEPKHLPKGRAKRIDHYNGLVIQLLLDAEIAGKKLERLLKWQQRINKIIGR